LLSNPATEQLSNLEINGTPFAVTSDVRTTTLVIRPIAIAIALALVARAAVRIYTIPSASMEPTLQVGDHIVVTPCERPQVGDVIVFRAPRGGDELLVKRVIATPGDLVEARAGRVVVSGHTVGEPYVAKQAASGAIPAQIVAADSYFVMGDNREDSLDSRSWGAVPRELVVGRVRLVLFSSGGSGLPQANAQTISAPSPARALRLDRLFRPVR
jgi:signal peptidase I